MLESPKGGNDAGLDLQCSRHHVLGGVREFHAQSLDESLAQRRQCLGRRGTRFLDGGDTPAANSIAQRDDPANGALLGRGLAAAGIQREKQDQAALGWQLAPLQPSFS
jgi:hypothetical protein